MRDDEIRTLLVESLQHREEPDPAFVEGLWVEIAPGFSGLEPVDRGSRYVDSREHVVVSFVPEVTRHRRLLRGPLAAVAAAVVVLVLGAAVALLQRIDEQPAGGSAGTSLTLEQACAALTADAPLIPEMLDGPVAFDGLLTAAELERNADAIERFSSDIEEFGFDDGDLVTSLGLVEGALIQASIQAGTAPTEDVQGTLDYARAELLEIADSPALVGCLDAGGR